MRPNRLIPGTDRDARWRPDLGHDTPAPRPHAAPAATPPPPAKPCRRAGKHRSQRKRREWQLRQGQHHGEVAFGFHNSRNSIIHGCRNVFLFSFFKAKL